MKLLTSLTSPFGRKIRIVLAEKRIECELVETNPFDPENSLSQANPLGKVPVLLLDDGAAVYDSRVIAEYLDNISPVSRLIPQDHRQAISVKRREALADGITDAAILILLERRRPARQQSREWVARQMTKITQGLVTLSEELGERKWLMGDAFSLADIATGCMLGFLDFRLPDIDWRTQHPNLVNFLNRLKKETPAFTETAPPANA
ncbi:glutathione S-transferase [Formivibrio citricus]|uniref:Glutathione S-transferase n=1 Tax=Formivibrio citricus TaxID=83765 RepID=A0A1I4WVR2_9NEIS|nr:glutathione S-transferase [Formivibrio citricus]SFN17243.1 glutathione S-transferase [Formivibrio citricus]